MAGDSAGWRAGVWPDVALAALITLGGQLELASSGQHGWHGLTHGLLLLAQTAPIATRRLAPAPSALVSAVALVVEAVATVSTNTLSALLAGLILIFSLGRHTSGRVLLVSTTVIAVAVAVHIVRLPGWQASDLAFAIIFSAAAWLAGRTLRRREHERVQAAADVLAERASAAAALETALVDERTRIARELHDVVAHGMGVMVVQAAAAEQLLANDPDAAREPLTTVRETGQGALAEMRRLLGLLRDGGVDHRDEPQPSLDELTVLVGNLGRAGMPVRIDITGQPSELPAGLQLCAYRIVQEALTNALKHAGGAATEVHVEHRAEELLIRVRNEPGPPSSASSSSPGHGLLGMRERVRLYGGTLYAAAQPEGSFVVEAVLPARP